MDRFFIGFVKSLLIFSGIIFSIHILLNQFILGAFSSFYAPWSIHLFLFFSTLLVVALVMYVAKNFPDKSGFAFLGGSFMKMMMSLLFLIPLIKNKELFNIINILIFFIPYFSYLTFETIIVLKLINKKTF